MSGFDQSFERLLGNEGALSLDPADRGNWTSGVVGRGELKGSKYGISAMSYPTLDIANISKDDAKAIYLRDFWERGQMDQYAPAIAFQIFDIAVNSAIETAVRMLQRAAGVADDGYIGPVTVAAVKSKSITDMLMLIIAERLDFWRRLTSWKNEGKGWAGRAATDLRFAAEDS